MKAWLYQVLNAEAKAWPYYVGDRPKQRRSIKDSLQTLRRALDCKAQWGNAYQTLGKVENSLHYAWSAGEHYRTASYEGYNQRMAEAIKRLGIPTIDNYPADFVKLCRVVISGPLIAVGNQQIDKEPGALSYRQLREVAELYREAGSTLYNFEV